MGRTQVMELGTSTAARRKKGETKKGGLGNEEQYGISIQFTFYRKKQKSKRKLTWYAKST
jgi:hypothetical protein